MPNGFFNSASDMIGLGPYGFLAASRIALYAILSMTIWQGLGFQIMIFLAGLESIPDRLP